MNRPERSSRSERRRGLAKQLEGLENGDARRIGCCEARADRVHLLGRKLRRKQSHGRYCSKGFG